MLYLIVAYDRNKVIGLNNEMPWHFKEDLAYFKKMTLHQTVLMGRKTYDSILAMTKKPLPNRKNIVVSSSLIDDRVEVISDLKSFLEFHKDSEEIVFVIGGASIYEVALPYIKRLYITHINASYQGDTFFPDWDDKAFKLIENTTQDSLQFKVYERSLR